MVTACATDATDIHPSTWVGNVTSLENGYVSPYTDGVPNILTLDAANGVCYLLISVLVWLFSKLPLSFVNFCSGMKLAT